MFPQRMFEHERRDSSKPKCLSFTRSCRKTSSLARNAPQTQFKFFPAIRRRVFTHVILSDICQRKAKIVCKGNFMMQRARLYSAELSPAGTSSGFKCILSAQLILLIFSDGFSSELTYSESGVQNVGTFLIPILER